MGIGIAAVPDIGYEIKGIRGIIRRDHGDVDPLLRLRRKDLEGHHQHVSATSQGINRGMFGIYNSINIYSIIRQLDG